MVEYDVTVGQGDEDWPKLGTVRAMVGDTEAGSLNFAVERAVVRTTHVEVVLAFRGLGYGTGMVRRLVEIADGTPVVMSGMPLTTEGAKLFNDLREAGVPWHSGECWTNGWACVCGLTA